MVLTRRQSKSILRRFPNEIIAEIIQSAPQADVVNLCRVSKLFHGLGAPVLYRDVDLESFNTVTFCRAILSNPFLTGLVRSLSSRSYDYDCPIRVFWNALRSLIHLENLSLRLPILKEDDYDAFLQMSFPRLVSCHLNQDTIVLTGNRLGVSVFLMRHPRLESFSTSMPLKAEPASQIPLSNLRRFWGPVELIPFIISRELRVADLFWGSTSDHDVEAKIVALASMTLPHSPFISCNHVNDISPTIIDSLSRNIPHTTTLHIAMVRMDGPIVPGDTTCAQVANYLPSFTCLRYLSIQNRFINFRSTEAVAHIISRAFWDVCPTLNGCRFDGYAWRKVDASWEKCSSQDFDGLAGITLPW
ncbi:hypothetical protein B0H11DRAFT_823932 [Mycena galericulata]|nr:hypothetical protein B0H11DRAFT_823932 [Mycena galericulata]